MESDNIATHLKEVKEEYWMDNTSSICKGFWGQWRHNQWGRLSIYTQALGQ
jgi:hypothetical protein